MQADTEEKLVSVIIPAYNMAGYITETLESVKKQTYQNWEAIIIDDGSTDGTKEAVKPFLRDKRFRYIFQENKGLAGARNTGIKSARGEFIALLDADDLFLPQKLERQVNFLLAHPECGVSYCDLYHFYDDQPARLLKLDYQFYSGQEVFPQLLKSNFINPLAVLLHCSVIEQYGLFNEAYRRTEDWEFWVRLAWGGVQFCFLPEPLAKYRIRRGTSLSYDSTSEVQRKKLELQIFVDLKKKMTLEQKRLNKIDSVIIRHWLKYVYARLSTRFAFMEKLRLRMQEGRLKKFSE